jgi:hypothetical protein
LGDASGPVKSAILGLNSAKLYGLDPGKILKEAKGDKIAAIKRKEKLKRA